MVNFLKKSIGGKKELAIKLSKLKPLDSYKIQLEQYMSDSEIAAEILWWAYMNGDIKGKIIADLGCGNGIFGVGSYLLKAKRVYFIDSDPKALKIAKANSKKGKFILGDVRGFNKLVDCVIMNPPFGVQKRKADKIFLEKAFEISKVIYSIHKIESREFIEKICKENNFIIKDILELDFLLKRVYDFHKKKKYYVKSGCWCLMKTSEKQV